MIDLKFAGVVVLYNPTNEINNNIKTYINSLEKLYVIDNSSINNESLLKKNKKIVYIPNYDNLGIATALNIGAKKAIEDGFDYLLTMDQDSHFEKNNVSKMINMIKNYPEDDEIEKMFGNDLSKIGLFSPLHVINNDPSIMGKPNSNYDSPLNVMTSGNFINLKAYQEINGFNDDFFIDCVDFEYCMHLRKKGYNIIRNNSAILNHELGNYVTKKIFGKTYSTFEHNHIRRYYIIRNRYYLCDMYWNDFNEYCKLEKKCTWKEIKLVWLCEKHKIKKTYYMIKGFIDFKKGKKGRIK